MPTPLDPREARLEAIARDELGFETLTTRNSDSLDFKEVAVWSLRNALREAYSAGRISGMADGQAMAAIIKGGKYHGDC